MNAFPFYSYRSGSGISSRRDESTRTHNQRALDTTMRRFPHLLSTCRDCGADVELIEETVKQRRDFINAEYRRVLGK